jgi:hypothetical protein
MLQQNLTSKQISNFHSSRTVESISDYLTWKDARPISDKNSGFLMRAWPSAWYLGTRLLSAEIACDIGFDRMLAASGDHPPLTLKLFDHSYRYLEAHEIDKKFITFQEVKIALPVLLHNYQQFLPPKMIQQMGVTRVSHH